MCSHYYNLHGVLNKRFFKIVLNSVQQNARAQLRKAQQFSVMLQRSQEYC